MKLDMKCNHKVRFADYFRRLLIGWILAALVEYLLLPVELRQLGTTNGLSQMSFLRFLIVMTTTFGGLSLVADRKNVACLERWILAGLCLILVSMSRGIHDAEGFALGCCGLMVIVLVYALYGTVHPITGLRHEELLAKIVTASLAVLFFLFVSNWTVSRVRSFSASSYDFGIFAQMFHSMKTTLLPMTTLERDGLLSHFQVHVSPIYYLMLPFYCLLPRPETLQVLQAAVLASAVIPLWLLGKEHGLGSMARMLLCAMLLVFPAYSGGTSYDLHENAFLTPLLLWLFYGLERRNSWAIGIFALLTLMVKEDAAVYVAVIALWVVVRALSEPAEDRRWGLTVGGGMLAGAVVWFLAVTGYLAARGDGVMTYRYDNFMFGNSGSLFSVIIAAVMNPMKVLFECTEPEKLEFITYTILPLLGLPLFTRKYHRYLLLIPYVLVNLMSDYSYQHDIFFQYTYGSTACLIYMSLVNLADWQGEWKRLVALAMAVLVGSVCLGKQVVPKAISYPRYCTEYESYYDSMRYCLETIPDNASVAATTFLTTELSNREMLYDVRYAAQEHVLSVEYVALKISDTGSFSRYAADGEDGYENLKALLEQNGFVLYQQVPGTLEIYWKEIE